jgi:orotate phosphoribosyltransferase-like protein
MGRKLDEETVKKIFLLRKAGLSYRKIAEILGINWQTAMYYCNPSARKSAYRRTLDYQRRHKEKVKEQKREWARKNKMKYYIGMLKAIVKRLSKEEIEELKRVAEEK